MFSFCTEICNVVELYQTTLVDNNTFIVVNKRDVTEVCTHLKCVLKVEGFDRLHSENQQQREYTQSWKDKMNDIY